VLVVRACSTAKPNTPQESPQARYTRASPNIDGRVIRQLTIW
jgi:hypothetical protein